VPLFTTGAGQKPTLFACGFLSPNTTSLTTCWDSPWVILFAAAVCYCSCTSGAARSALHFCCGSSTIYALLTCCYGDAQTSMVGGARASKSTLESWNSIARSPIIFKGSYWVVG